MEVMVTQKICLRIKKKQVHKMVVTNHSENGDSEEHVNRYLEMREWREKHIHNACDNPTVLNQFHDRLMKETVQKAIEKIESELGPAPAHFAFFIMGSAGRSEQAIWSDQDHGIIFAGGEESKPYFLKLGIEISNGLSVVGYERCDGKVMASNPKWCNSMNAWEQQIGGWLKEASWESLRYFSTFFDSRVLLGDDCFLSKLKELAFQHLREEPYLYIRLLENISHIKKGIGILGQLLPNSSGKETGYINMKEVILFSYVNSLRLLSLKEEILAPSTLTRFQQLSNDYKDIKKYQLDFEKLLKFRLYYKKYSKSYADVHFLKITSLSKSEKQELKQIMKNGYKLFAETKNIIIRGCSS
jgi:CBS domain-containing protein